MQFQAPESLAEQIAQHVGRQIITGQLQAGERIQEMRIASELQVSRGSVREALLILERRYLVDIFPRRGAAVSYLTAEHVVALYDMYEVLLKLLVTRFMTRWDETDIVPLVNQLQRINKLVLAEEPDIAAIIEAGFELMELCYPRVANPYLKDTLDNLRPAISRTYYLAMRQKPEELFRSMQFFNHIVKAVQEQDMREAETLIARFAKDQRALILGVLAGDPPMADVASGGRPAP